MEIQSYEIFAEISVALLGFASITAAVAGQTRKPEVLTARIKGLLMSATIACVGSIAPLTHLDIIYCAVGYLFLLVIFLVWSGLEFFRNRDAKWNMQIWIVGYSLTISTTGFLLYSLLTATELIHVAYICAICVSLGMAGTVFVRFVLVIISGEEQR